MPPKPTQTRYQAEADYALARLKHYREQGDGARADHWHRAWSLSATAADAERREKGAGTRVLRRHDPPPLRPLPEDVPPLASPSVEAPLPVPERYGQAMARRSLLENALRQGGVNPFPAEVDVSEWENHLAAYRAGGPSACVLLQQAIAAVDALSERMPGSSPTPIVCEPDLPQGAAPTIADPLAAAIRRHDLIANALLAGGPNPLSDELDEGEWQYHLTAYHSDGPYECELLQAAEAAVEALVEMQPEPETDPECLRIYRESLAELSEDELHTDLDACQRSGHRHTAALIEAELRRREREDAPPLPPR